MEIKILTAVVIGVLVVGLPQRGLASAIGTMQTFFYDASFSSNGVVSAHMRFSDALYCIDRGTNDLWSVTALPEGYGFLSEKTTDNQAVILKSGERIVLSAPYCQGYFAAISADRLDAVEDVPEEYLRAERLLALRFRVCADVVVNGNEFVVNELYVIDPIRNRAWDCVNKKEEMMPFPFTSTRVPVSCVPENLSTDEKNCVWRLLRSSEKIRANAESELFRLRNDESLSRYFMGETINLKPVEISRSNQVYRGFLCSSCNADGMRCYILIELSHGDVTATISCFDNLGRIRRAMLFALPEDARCCDRYYFDDRGTIVKASQTWHWGEPQGFSFAKGRIALLSTNERESFDLEVDSEIRTILGVTPVTKPLTREEIRKTVGLD